MIAGTWSQANRGLTEPHVHIHGRLYSCAADQARHAVLTAWQQRGDQLLEVLDGDFTAVIETADEFVGVIDPIGGSQYLFYSLQDGHLYWSTDLDELVRRVPQATRNDDFLYSYLASDILMRHPYDEQETLYREIHLLLPGQLLHLRDGQLDVRRVWSWTWEEPARMSFDEAVEAFDHVFRRAVAKRIGDRSEIGLMLSGGLDSTAVAIAATDVLGPDGVKSVSYVFPDLPLTDESERIERFTQQLGLRWQGVRADQFNLFEDWLEHFPAFAFPCNPTNISGVRVSSEQFQTLGVDQVFTGHGGDGAFAASFYAPVLLMREKRWREFRQWWRQAKQYPERPARFLWKEVLVPAFFKPEQKYNEVDMETLRLPRWLTSTSDRQRTMQADRSFLYQVVMARPDLERSFEADFMYQRAGITLSHPFMDRDLMRLVKNLPPWYLHYPVGETKVLLKAWMTQQVGPEVVARNSKKAGSVSWMMSSLHQARRLLDERLQQAEIFELGLIERTGFLQSYIEFQQGKFTSETELNMFIKAVMLESWLGTRHSLYSHV